ncbi:hypothetical protein [Actinoplanes awajinensis]|uniref:hypothetical protein n=1 Tax=Actinoplanes awajinensis TaxID=135946 RepID=UPI0012FCCE9D|nr:hypothetical protein [Actinoplanes awajinensis]
MIDPGVIDLEDFAHAWWGPPDSVAEPIQAEHQWLPEILKDWLVFSSRWNRRNISMLRFFTPDRIERFGEKAFFLEDSCGEWRWAFDVEEPDIVYDAEVYKGEEAQAEWTRNEETLGEVIRHSVVHDALLTAAHTRIYTHVPARLLGDVLRPLQPVGFGSWRWPSPQFRIFMGNGLLADLSPSRYVAGHFGVQLSAADEAAFIYLNEIPGIDH